MIDSLIFIVLMLNKFPQMLLRDVLSLTHISRWALFIRIQSQFTRPIYVAAN